MTPSEIRLTGIPASPGIAIGPARIIADRQIRPDPRALSPHQIETEQKRLLAAFDSARSALAAMIERCEGERAKILVAHMSMLEDPYWLELCQTRIGALCAAERAVWESSEEIAQQFLALEDDYMRERVTDLRDEAQRVLRHLSGIADAADEDDPTPAIVVARELAPSDTAAMDFTRVLGFLADMGGGTSHAAIMARTMGIPAIVGARDAMASVQPHEMIIVDGQEGTAILHPQPDTLLRYRQRQREWEQRLAALRELRDLPAVTRKGRRVELVANVGAIAECDDALAQGAEGIGLLRTEFLYMDNTHFPTEEEQVAAYRAILKKMGDKPVIIRTLDIGGDKNLPYYEFPHEENPFLGCRAIRFCRERGDVFETQVRAILRAAAGRQNVRVMIPMVISVDEVRFARETFDRCRAALLEAGMEAGYISLGIMVETPASVLIADELVAHVDFFSIGSNDLTQYILAVDRGNERIQDLYDFMHPAVLRAIAHVIEVSHRAGKWTGVCGEMAGDVRATHLLLHMGLDEFSMNAPAIPFVKETIRAYED